MATALNIAHRGGAGLAPENTLPAFAGAIARGCDGAELDVQLSADGRVVVHHDFRLNRALTRRNGIWLTEAGLRIRDLSFAQLQDCDVGRPDPASAYARAHPLLRPADGARIPALADVVALAAAAPRPFLLFVELKSSADPDSGDAVALADAALAVLEGAHYLDRTIFVGFDWRGLLRVRTRSDRARCWFSTDRLQGDARPVLDGIKAAGADGWFPRFPDATVQNIAAARRRGLKVGAWTVNDPADMRRLAGLDAICTDRPDLLSQTA